MMAWDLLKDVIPDDPVAEADPSALSAAAIANAPRGPVLVLGPPDPWWPVLGATAGGASTRELLRAAWPSLLDPSPAGELHPSGGRFPAVGAGVLLVSELLEEADDPETLLAAVRPALAPDAAVVGICALLDPEVRPRLRTLTPVGLRVLLERAGFTVTSVAPGPHTETFTQRRAIGRAPNWPFAANPALSPGHAQVAAWGQQTRRRPALVRNRMLQFAGAYAWTATQATSAPTAWYGSLERGEVGPQPVAEQAMRRFEVTMPAGSAPRSVRVEAPLSGFIARQLAQTGLRGYEPESVAAVLAASDCAGPGAIYDIGANIGVFAVAAAAATTRDVLAFEPVPDLAEVARRTAEVNRLTRLSVHELAFSDRSGTALFFVSAVSDASSSLNATHRPHARSMEVTLSTVDHFVAQAPRHVPAVLKIDTETTEPDVVRGALATLSEHRPWIVCEVLRDAPARMLTELLEPLGYSYARITPERRWPAADRIAPDPGRQHHNWLISPGPLDRRFWSRVDAWRGSLAACGARAL